MQWCFFFFNDTATTEIYTLSLHDALPIFSMSRRRSDASPSYCWTAGDRGSRRGSRRRRLRGGGGSRSRSEEHTSELQSRQYLVCRLLLVKKKHTIYIILLLLSIPHQQTSH